MREAGEWGADKRGVEVGGVDIGQQVDGNFILEAAFRTPKYPPGDKGILQSWQRVFSS